MKKSRVRCWKIVYQEGGVHRKHELFITYPEDNTGHGLISCLNCGHIYSYNISKMVYVGPPLAQALSKINCVVCNAILSNTYSKYPEKFKYMEGICEYIRDTKIPPADSSIIREFDEIY